MHSLRISRLRRVLARFQDQTIIVTGDVMLDQFLWGSVSRISPEAPVPVVEVTRESFFPGGAANVARNLRALGASVNILGVRGRDEAGRRLGELLEEQGIETRGLIVVPDRPTTLKTRIVAHHQQVVRFDREKAEKIPPSAAEELMETFRAQVGGVTAVIFEDYGKGVLSQKPLDEMQRLARQHGKITAADPNPRNPLRYTGLTAITPNRAEAFTAAGVTSTEPSDDVLHDEPLMRVGRILLSKWKVSNLLVTLGEDGMCLFRAGQRPHHIPTVAQEVFDVSGAGDTVIATLTLALAAGANPADAAEISNHAAGVVVGKIGTATCSPEELLESFSRHRR
jgi:D-glycero-beta-D-manno-heptose-7-phosphate kinase